MVIVMINAFDLAFTTLLRKLFLFSPSCPKEWGLILERAFDIDGLFS